MDHIIAISVDRNIVRPHELIVVTETGPSFLPPATFAEAEGRQALLYSIEGLTPLAHYGEGTGASVMRLSAVFDMLTGYMRALLGARDMLLDTALLSSDADRGVYIRKGLSAFEIKILWGADTFCDDSEKICRIASVLASRERIMGAKTAMERMIDIIRSENPSILDCLKIAESLCREWNGITLSQN